MYAPNITCNGGKLQTTCSIPNIWDSTVITNVHFHLNVSFIPLPSQRVHKSLPWSAEDYRPLITCIYV